VSPESREANAIAEQHRQYRDEDLVDESSPEALGRNVGAQDLQVLAARGGFGADVPGPATHEHGSGSRRNRCDVVRRHESGTQSIESPGQARPSYRFPPTR
jgi:hypothetical protein